MNFATWSIRNPVPALLFFILLTVFGLNGFHKLGIQQFPDMDLPTIQIAASLEGAAPEQLETEVARKIEDKLASLSLLDHITTTVTDGLVSISVSFIIDKDSEEALNEVRNAVDGVTADLPQGMAMPTVSKVTTQGSALLTYSIVSDKLDEQDLSWFVDDEVTKAALSVKGVAEVDRYGGVDREVHVDLDPTAMNGLGMTANDVSTQLKSVEKDNSGGLGEVGSKRQSLRTLAQARAPEEIGAITLPLSDGRRIRLDQIAKVSDGYADRSSLAYRDGKQVILFQIKRSKGFSDASVAANLRAEMEHFAAIHPEVKIEEASTTVTPIIENYHGSMHLLLEGALLAVIVVWLFLKDWRGTLISATALPLSIIPAFAVMYWAGFSLNTVSLLALSLVIGILVDDAIVEVENISRHMQGGKSVRSAAMEAATEIGLAVIATTFALVAVFLPTAFMDGIPGIIFRQFGVTASVAVIASLLVARLLTPMMAAYFMRPTKHVDQDGAIMKWYLAFARKCIDNRGKTLAAVALFFLCSLSLIPMISTAFFPAQDNAQTKAMLTLSPGSTLNDTVSVTNAAYEILKGIPEVAHVIAAVGTSGGGSSGPGDSSTTSDPRTSTLTIDLVPRSDRSRSQAKVEDAMRLLLKTLPGARVEVGSGGNGEQLDITLASDDTDALDKAASAVESDLRTLKGIGNVTSSAALQRPEIQNRPDYARAAALGVTSTDLADAVRLATNGAYSQNMAKLNLPQRQINVRVRFDPTFRNDIDNIKQIRVAGANGSIALSSVADVAFGSGPSQIDRIDRSRNVTMSIELNGRPLGDVMREAKELTSLHSLPSSVRLVEQGELQRMSELFGSFGMTMGIGIFCIYAVLVLLFHDFMQPVTILMALPLSLGGALSALLFTGQNFSMPSIIGLLMLMGIVTKNSILLVEYAIMSRREHGLSRTDALIDACHKRARPILMTTIAMGAGMMPIALGLGADPSFRQPMAIVVIGGLLTSTALSLLVIPVVFTLIDDLKLWLTQRAKSTTFFNVHTE